MPGSPPDDAYGRVTNAERFRPLHDIADALVAQLVRDYEVDMADALDVDPELSTRSRGCLRMVRLTPSNPGAAPLTFAWSAFPGLHVRMGRWHITSHPGCGCDACAEQVDDEADQLRWAVAAVVAGGLREAFDGKRLSYELGDEERRMSGWQAVPREQRPRFGDHRSYRWDRWPHRAATEP